MNRRFLRTRYTTLIVVFCLIGLVSSCSRLGSSSSDTLPSLSTQQLSGEWTDLFNGQDFGGWYTYLPSEGTNSDTKGVFKVVDGMLHILDIPETDETQEFGYLATTEAYGNYHLRFQYRWGTKKFAPRDDKPRDTGLLFHVQGNDRVWPRSVETQIMEQTTGDMWLIGGTRATTTVASLNDTIKRYKPGGSTFTNPSRAYFRIRAAQNMEVGDWNTVDVRVYGNKVIYQVNGATVFRASNLRDSSSNALSSGRILLQAEGAEVYYKDIQIRAIGSLEEAEPTDPQPTDPFPTPSRITLFDGSSTDAWRPSKESGQMWPVTGGALEVLPGATVGANDIETLEHFQDFKLHVEFMTPLKPFGTAEQARGNSGIYLQGRYEVQILDSYRRALSGANDSGAIYGVANASRNMSKPAGTWQKYDITFRAPRFDAEGSKLSPARVTVFWNGSKVQDARIVQAPTTLGDSEDSSYGPIRLQDHKNRVKYRNIWLEPL